MRIFAALAMLSLGSQAFAAAVNDPALTVETVTTGLVAPTGIAFIGDDDILVIQQLDGRVLRIIGGVLQPNAVLDLPVDTSLLDRGLLGITLDPDFAHNGFVYLFYCEATSDGGTPLGIRVTRFRWDGASLVEPFIVIALPIRPNVFRIGGIVRFGADDLLYTVFGDQQFFGKLQNVVNGIDPNDTSVIMRTSGNGFVPSDNPFYGSTGSLAPMSRYYAYGLRNSFGMAFDPVTGALWDTENGQAIYDEINRVDPGFNSGWVQIQGPVSRSPHTPADLWMAAGAHYADPTFSWQTPVAPTSITFLRNAKLGCGRLHDVLTTGTNCGLLYHFPMNASRTGFALTSPELADLVADNGNDQCGGEQEEIIFGTDFGIITDLETGPDALVYVLSADQGVLYRIVPNRPATEDADGDGVEDACDCAPGDAGSFSMPDEMARIRLSGAGPTHLGWNDRRPDLGSAVGYDLVTGRLSDLHSSGGFGATCTLGASLASPAFDDARGAPPAGDGFYYLLRAANGCGTGTFGDSSLVPDPRDLLDATLPNACEQGRRPDRARVDETRSRAAR
jgi:glucose/arabinose dehydrogenase